MGRHRSATRMAVLLALAVLPLVGCSSDDDGSAASADGAASESGAGAGATKLDEAAARRVVEHYAEGVSATYAASVAAAEQMQASISEFLAAPSPTTLAIARQAWENARVPYGITEAYRFYGGPIDDEETGPEGRINGWPLDEQYIDETTEAPGSGIIADTAGFPEITAEALIDANEQGGEANLSLGWHAIEFLLWGQDRNVTGPGDRPFTDYTTAPNAARRAQYLTVATQQLVDDLRSVSEQWAPDADNYRAEFLEQPVERSITDMITGIGELSRGELAGERMNVAYEEREQENEHSCFSDTTTADLVANAQGIANVWLGTYPDVAEGPGLATLLDDADPGLSGDVTAAIADSVATISSIPAPFDSNLTADAPDDGPGRTAIRESIDLLGVQTDLIVKAGSALGVDIEVS